MSRHIVPVKVAVITAANKARHNLGEILIKSKRTNVRRHYSHINSPNSITRSKTPIKTNFRQVGGVGGWGGRDERPFAGFQPVYLEP